MKRITNILLVWSAAYPKFHQLASKALYYALDFNNQLVSIAIGKKAACVNDCHFV